MKLVTLWPIVMDECAPALEQPTHQLISKDGVWWIARCGAKSVETFSVVRDYDWHEIPDVDRCGECDYLERLSR